MKNGIASREAGLLVAAAVFLGAGQAQAEIAAQNEVGFRTEHSILTQTSAKNAWTAVLAPGEWWSSAHTWSGEAANLRLDAKVGGCWCEKWKGGAVRHMTVVSLIPGSTLVMEGGLGPLQSMGVNGAMTISVKPEGDGARISFSYSVGGFFDPPVDAIAPAVDAVIGEQAGRLKAYLETK